MKRFPSYLKTVETEFWGMKEQPSNCWGECQLIFPIEMGSYRVGGGCVLSVELFLLPFYWISLWRVPPSTKEAVVSMIESRVLRSAWHRCSSHRSSNQPPCRPAVDRTYSSSGKHKCTEFTTRLFRRCGLFFWKQRIEEYWWRVQWLATWQWLPLLWET